MSRTDESNGLQTLIVQSGLPVASVGYALVVNASEAAPGIIGSVISRHTNADGSTTVTLKPTAPSEAFIEFKVAYSAPIENGAVTQSRPQTSKAFKNCSGTPGSPTTFETDFTRNAKVSFDLDVFGPSVHFLYVANPKTTLSVHGALGATCSLVSPRVRFVVPGTPFVVNVGPKVDLEVTSGMNMDLTYESRVVIGFDHSRNLHQNIWVNHKVASTLTSGVSGSAEATLFVGAAIELMGGGLVGLGGQAGVEIRARATADLQQACVGVDAALALGLYAKLDAFVKNWTWDLAQGKFLRTDIAGPACTPKPHPPPTGGGGTPSGGATPPPPPGGGGGTPPSGGTTWAETTGGATNTWTNYTNAGGTQGATIPAFTTVQIACKLTGFRVADGNTWWYRIASSPWNNTFYASADAFYNNGATSGSLSGTPFVDPNVADCPGSAPPPPPPAPTWAETTGGATNTWTNYTNAGGTQGATIPAFTTVQIACKLTGFRVADGNTWWYRIASSPWNNTFYASADAFYNNGATSGSLSGTPFVDPNVADC